jgi:acetyltransferase-like isoleucine patch superfamily enzyme
VLDNDLVLDVQGRLEIGARTIFGHHCTLAASDSIIIGEDCLIAEMVAIRDHNHNFARLDVPDPLARRSDGTGAHWPQRLDRR